MTTLQNDILQIKIHPRGAEMQGIYNKQAQLEYLWNADPANWARHAPILFPIVGQLRDNSYRYKGNSYSMNRHGFAREMEFTVVQTDDLNAVFSLGSSAETLAAYPFEFLLNIHYHLADSVLSISYEVYNPGSDNMYFSIGAHPAFAVPLVKHTTYTDYYLQFSSKETADRWPLQNGLVLPEPVSLLVDQDRLALTKELFYNDALVCKHLASTSIAIKSDQTPHGITVHFPGFPYLGIWAAPDAPFVCIEPWFGLADSVYHYGDFTQKEGIITLPAESKWQHGWQIECR